MLTPGGLKSVLQPQTIRGVNHNPPDFTSITSQKKTYTAKLPEGFYACHTKAHQLTGTYLWVDMGKDLIN